MSKNYIEDLMNILKRDTNNGKFDYEDEDMVVIDDDYDYDEDYDDDEIVVIDDDYYEEDEDEDEADQIVVDQEYIPDELEEDLFDKKYTKRDSDNNEDISIFDLCDDDPDCNFSFIELLNKKNNYKKKEEINNEIVDDKIAKGIAKDVSNAEVLLTEKTDDNDAWLSEDMFGNDIGKIIVEEEPKEKETYSKGEFSDWVKTNKKSK